MYATIADQLLCRPQPFHRLKTTSDTALQACNSALSGAEFYDHPKTAQWNQTIIVCYHRDSRSNTATPAGLVLDFERR